MKWGSRHVQGSLTSSNGNDKIDIADERLLSNGRSLAASCLKMGLDEIRYESDSVTSIR